MKGESRKHSFEDLDVWKKSCRLTVDLYRRLKEIRDWGFRDQACRAAVSIPSNIAEGFERGSTNEFVRFLFIAKGSAGELRTQLYLATELGYLQKEVGSKLREECKHISAMIQNLITSLKKRVRRNNFDCFSHFTFHIFRFTNQCKSQIIKIWIHTETPRKSRNSDKRGDQ